jgi:glutathione S-transferase
LRFYNVFESRLSGHYTGIPRDFLAGEGKGKYSIADIGTWAYVRNWRRAGFTEKEMAQFPNFLEWLARIAARPAVQRGISDVYDSEKNPDHVVSTKR